MATEKQAYMARLVVDQMARRYNAEFGESYNLYEGHYHERIPAEELAASAPPVETPARKEPSATKYPFKYFDPPAPVRPLQRGWRVVVLTFEKSENRPSNALRGAIPDQIEIDDRGKKVMVPVKFKTDIPRIDP
jgi:hypothetical protein